MKRALQRIMLASAFTLALPACGGGEDTAKADKAAALAKKIQASPDTTEAILKEAGMTPAQYEALLKEIALDPVLTEAYANAMGK